MFLIPCPICGPRDGSEFHWQGEAHPVPSPEQAASFTRDQWASYLYVWSNPRGVTREWCFHAIGCEEWFIAERDTRTNRVLKSYFNKGAVHE